MKNVHPFFFYSPLLALFVIGFFLRSQMFLQGNLLFLPDQGRDMQLVRDIVINHNLTLIGGHTGFGGLFHGPLWFYLLSPFFLITNGNPFWTLVSVYLLVSLSLIVGGYIVVNKLYGSKAGLLFSGFIAFSEVFRTTIQYTSNSQVMSLVFLGYLYFAVNYFRGKKHFFPFVMLSIGIGMHFESAFAVFLIPITFLSMVITRRLPTVKLGIMGIGFFLLSVSSFIIFDLRHQFLMTNALLRLLRGKYASPPDQQQYSDITYRISDRADWFLHSFGNILADYSVILERLLFVIVFAFFAMVGVKVWKKITLERDEQEALFVFAMIVAVFSLYVLYPGKLYGHYVESVSIAAILVVVLMLINFLRNRIGKILVAIFLCLNMLVAFQTLFQIYNKPQIVTTNAGILANQIETVDWVYEDSQGKPFGYFIYDPPIVTYGMDYLFWWRGNTKYHMSPQSEKINPTYLILFQAPQGDLHAHDFWIKNTLRTKGRVIIEKKFPSGLKVLKLEIKTGEDPVDPNYYTNLIFR